MKGKGVKLTPYPEKTTFKKPSPIRVKKFSKQLTHKSKDYDIGFSPEETNFEKIVYLNRVGNFEEYVGCLAPRNDKKSKRFFGLVNSFFTTGWKPGADPEILKT